MIASAIQNLATSSRSTRVAAAVFEKTVQIWDLKTRERIKEFETVFRFGGYRLTLDPAGEKCVAAAWKKGKGGGVACYEASTGRVIWHRQDLRHTQRVRFSPDGMAVWCVQDSSPTKLLDSADGKTLDSIVGLRNLFDSEYSPALLLEKRKRDYILRKDKPVKIPRLTFAILDAAFGPHSMVLSESGGHVRCITTSTGAEMWRHSPVKGSHFLKLWYRLNDGNFYGVLWNFQEGNFRSLVRLEATSGEPRVLRQLNSWEEAHSAKLDCVITSSGELVSLSEGSVLHRLEFPKKVYPDQNDVLEVPRAK
jgi:outer membrane protein assembly factor BamB